MTWDYIAGFIDGEGSIVKRERGYAVHISQTNFQVLDKIRKFVGGGHVHAITKRKKHWKDAWVYNARKSEDVYNILFHTSGKLIVKQKLAKHALKKVGRRIKELKEKENLQLTRFSKGKRLREQGLTYREIGKKLGTDFGYVRRLIIQNKWR